MIQQISTNQSNDALRDDITNTRRRMDGTVDRLVDRIQPRHLLNDLLDYWQSRRNKPGEPSHLGEALQDNARRAKETLARQIRENPMPTMLIGAGLAWLILDPGRREADRYSGESGEFADEPFDAYTQDYANQEKSRGMSSSGGAREDYSAGGYAESDMSKSGGKASEVAGQVKQKVRQGAERMRERARDQGRDIRERARVVGHRVQRRLERGYQAAQDRLSAGYDRSRERLRETADVHPLCTGAAVLGLGLVAGFLLPRTRREDQWFGDASDSVKRRVKESGQDLVQRGKHVAEAAAQTAKSEAERQGLTPDKLKESVQEIGRKAQDAAQRTAEEEGVLPESMKAGGEGAEATGAEKASGASGTGAATTQFPGSATEVRKTEH